MRIQEELKKRHEEEIKRKIIHTQVRQNMMTQMVQDTLTKATEKLVTEPEAAAAPARSPPPRPASADKPLEVQTRASFTLTGNRNLTDVTPFSLSLSCLLPDLRLTQAASSEPAMKPLVDAGDDSDEETQPRETPRDTDSGRYV